jgi:HEAT repeat protein
MPALPTEAWELIRQIPVAKGIPSDFVEARVAKGGVRVAIPFLSLLLFDRRLDVAERAMRVLPSLLQTLHVSELPALDQEMRRYRPWDTAWDRLQPGDVRGLKAGPATWASLALLSMHRTGYIREAALRRLAESTTGAELPYFFLRLNDWVLEIRRFAESVVSARLTPESASELVQVLPLAARLSRWSRAARDIESRINQVLLTPMSRKTMRAGLEASDPAIRRLVVRLLIEAGSESILAILDTILQDKDVIVRTLAAAAARESLDGQALRDALDRMGRNRAARVRQEALIGWISRFPGESRDRLVRALLDRITAVRGLAQYELKKRGFDVVGFYRTEVTSRQSPDPTAILGIGEVGGSEDENFVEPHLMHPDLRIRCAAVHAIGRIGGEKRASLLLAALRDPAPAVSKAARRELVGNPTGADYGSLLSVFEEDDRPYVRRNCFRVLATASKWAWIRYAVIAASDPDPEVRSDGLEQIDLWTLKWNRSFVEPTTSDIKAIGAAIQRLDGELRASVLHRIGFFLGPSWPSTGK